MEAARLLDERGRGLERADEGRPVAPQRPDLQEALDEAMEIDGALGVALVDGGSGMSLGVAGGGAGVNVELAAAGAADLVRGQQRGMAALGAKGTLEGRMVPLGEEYHPIP